MAGAHCAGGQRCGLATNSYATKHCFADPAHNTCCLLDMAARSSVIHKANHGDRQSERAGVAAEHNYRLLHNGAAQRARPPTAPSPARPPAAPAPSPDAAETP